MLKVKICGITKLEDLITASNSGAAYAGFVFHNSSPRNISLNEAAELAYESPIGMCKVALVVDPLDSELESILNSVPIDMIQLHGQESPERVYEIKKLTNLPLMKAIGVRSKKDLKCIDDYSLVSDQLLIDSKAIDNSGLPGGNGLVFDWNILKGFRWLKPWMLAGGLDSQNVIAAIKITGAEQIDVSSGVESSPGRKSEKKIKTFLETVSGVNYGK